MTKNHLTSYPIHNSVLYDFIFIGLGACNSLIVLALLKNGSLADKKVAIIETASKNTNDKTYCFWASLNDSIVSDLAPLVTHYYNTIKVSDSIFQNIEAQPYYYIRSIDLYKHTLDFINKAQIKIYRETVNKVSCESEIYSVHTKNAKYQTRHIFDSRPPSLSLLKSNQIYLHQSFYGLHIKCEKDVFQEHSFEMMNFNVEQSNYTQFIYALPFSSRESLIELTRFGADKIDLNYAKDILDKIISKDFGKYEILADESGCIPMTTFVNKPSTYRGVLHTGASANLIKPSTGYGFKNMYAFARIVAERIMEDKYHNFNQICLKSKKRFVFYDRLLLTILLYFPSEGKKIFTQLYKNQSIATVFMFLDERTSLYKDFKIFISLPVFPFLKALFIFFKKENWLRYIFAFLVAMVYVTVACFSEYIAFYFSYFILISGFMVIGIPHGGLDHMLSKTKSISLFQFVFVYLVFIVVYFTLWHYFSLYSLIFFIIFSSFHFGESELEGVGFKISSIISYIKVFLFGLSILFFILFTHFEESISVISKFNDIHVAPYIINYHIYSWHVASVCFIYIISQSVIAKKYSHLGLLFLLILGTKVPLILAFGFYFIFQHSYNAWRHLQIGLNLNSISLYKMALPYTLGALVISLTTFIINSNFILNPESFFANIFIFLSCISLPHFLLMHLFYRNKFCI